MDNKKYTITVRMMTLQDIPHLIALHQIAYPEISGSSNVWDHARLESHLAVFPQGQLVAEIDGHIVGAAASLVIDFGQNPLRHHTWAGITDNGYFTNHDPHADTLYGADVYVDPQFRSCGVGAAIYAARRALCQQLNKRRILAGGRLSNYHDYASDMSAAEYVQRVAAGEIPDPVLSFQLREGFSVKGVMPHYFEDPFSKNFASLIEWTNPNYQSTTTAQHKVRVACVQYKMRKVKSFDDFANQVTYFIDVAGNYHCDFVLLPELFTMQLLSMHRGMTPLEGMRQLATYTEPFIGLMRDLAQRFNLTIIAGSHPQCAGNLLLNVSTVCLPNGDIADNSKLHITPSERRWWGIKRGDTSNVIHTPKATIGVLICYDIEFPYAARHLADEGADIIFVPFCTDNRQGYLRVRYCAHARSIENVVYVAIAGNVGNLPDVPNMDIQYAQSAVLTPSDFEFSRDGIKAEAEPNEETMLICDLNLDDLHKMHREGTVTPRFDRRDDLILSYVQHRLGKQNKYLGE